MKLNICAVGRLKNGPERDLWKRYATRIDGAGKPLGLGPLGLTEIPEARDQTAATRKTAEAAKITSKIDETHLVIALHEKGTQVTSHDIAASLKNAVETSTKGVSFVIGGPDGLCPTFLGNAAHTWAFGRITLPHGLVRAILVEQLYRAITILNNHPYHRA